MTARKKSLGALHEGTRDLHHAIELTPVGAAMATGTPRDEWFAAWLAMKHEMHRVLDPILPPAVRRRTAFEADRAAWHLQADPPPAVVAHMDGMTSERQIVGTAYVLIGGNLMGGAKMARTLAPRPVTHAQYPDRSAALSILHDLRDRGDAVEEARECFAALIRCMEEIEARWPA